jgi:predicted alpha/beta superfamily hydrolase
MLTRPGTFRRYIAASCTWPGADELLLGRLADRAKQPDHPPTDLFLAIGDRDEDQTAGFQKIVQALQAARLSNLRLFSQVLEGEGHSSGVLAKAFLNGLRMVFADEK